jgi:hypothetical protein
MPLSVAELQVSSLSERVQAMTSDQIQAVLNSCEAMLRAQGLNESAMGFGTIFNAAQLMLFEWYLANPEMLTSLTQGRSTEAYSVEIPKPILQLLGPIRQGGFGRLKRRGGV